MVKESTGFVEFDAGELERLSAVFVRVGKKSDDLSFALGESVRIVKKFSTANFILKGGGKYEPLTPKYRAYKKSKFGNLPILVRTGKLRDSVVGVTADSIIQVGKKTATVGTKTKYASFIQDGTKKMAARPFLAITTPMVDAIDNTFKDNIEKDFEEEF